MFRAAAVFSNHMVLQRDKRISIFGEGISGSRISAVLYKEEKIKYDSENEETFDKNNKRVSGMTVCRDGKWMLYLPALSADTGYVMEITDGNTTILFEDIAIGEVWLAGGQSNMELELQNADGGKELLALGKKQPEAQEYAENAANAPEAAVRSEVSAEKQDNKRLLEKIRYYYTPKQAYKGADFEETERASGWELFNDTDGARWSAVGVYYAMELVKSLNVTVGILGCNWGGTSASCWMSREAVLEQKATESYIKEYESSDCVKKSEEEQIKEYEEYQRYQEEWDQKAAEVYAKEPMISFVDIQKLLGPCRYPGPMNCANFTRPAGLYETMLKRVAPYTVRGFIYYQGESDDHKPDSYYALFTRMIRQWREDFGDDSLPFLTVQLPMHRYQHDPDTGNWCILREAQMKAYQTVKNTGIAVIIDCGQFHEIHPKNKKPVGERLALQALSFVYGLIEEDKAFGPVYQDFLYRDGGMEITFTHAKEGITFTGNVPNGFELAGEDGIFEKAEASFAGNKVFLTSENIKEPVMARYLWTNYSEVNVFGKNSLPMAPFRTHYFA